MVQRCTMMCIWKHFMSIFGDQLIEYIIFYILLIWSPPLQRLKSQNLNKKNTIEEQIFVLYLINKNLS